MDCGDYSQEKRIAECIRRQVGDSAEIRVMLDVVPRSQWVRKVTECLDLSTKFEDVEGPGVAIETTLGPYWVQYTRYSTNEEFKKGGTWFTQTGNTDYYSDDLEEIIDFLYKAEVVD